MYHILPLFAESYQNVSVNGEGCQAGGASSVSAPAGSSDSHVETGSAEHQCKLYNQFSTIADLHTYLCNLQWTNQNWTQFYERCKQAIETFEVLVARVHDIYSNRILNVLMWMQDVSLQILPAGRCFLTASVSLSLSFAASNCWTFLGSMCF